MADGKDARLMTDLPVHPYLEACKTWGAAVERFQKLGHDGERLPFSVLLDCLRVYEFERYKAQVEEARADALDAKANADRWS